jgi:hypothetical protein
MVGRLCQKTREIPVGGFILCLLVSIVEWFLVAKRTAALARGSRFAGLIVFVEVAIGLGTGYVIFVNQNLLALGGCALGAGLGAELARRRK